jgi:hypothetical protein
MGVGVCVEEEAVGLREYRKQRERKGLGPSVTFKGILPVIHFLQLGPTSQSFHHLPKECHWDGIKHLTHESGRGTVHIQTITAFFFCLQTRVMSAVTHCEDTDERHFEDDQVVSSGGNLAYV